MKKNTIWRFAVATFAVGVLGTGSFSCSLFTGPKKGSNVDLSAADVISAEVWLKIGFADSPGGGEYEIKRDGNVVLEGSFNGTDTVVVDTTVEPSRSYIYEGYRMEEGKAAEESSPVEVTTPDTTNSNFSWELYKFGDLAATGMSSELYGVAVINDTDIWAVGKIYTADSVGMCNAVHWDGKGWELTGIPFTGPCSGGVLYPPLKAVCQFDSKRILASDGGSIAKYDGQTATIDCGMNSLLNGAINKIFLPDTGNIYAVGNSGAAVYSGSHGWSRIQSNTTEDLFDIYSGNGKDIYVAGGNLQDYSGILLKGNSNGFQTVEEGRNLPNLSSLFHPYFDGVAKTVWVSNAGTVYFGGDGLYIYTGGETAEVRTLQGNRGSSNISGMYFGFISQIRGISENDMVLVGERNTIRYFNGAEWTQLGMPYDPSSDYTWLSVGMTPDMIVAVGFTTNDAVIMMLKRE